MGDERVVRGLTVPEVLHELLKHAQRHGRQEEKHLSLWDVGNNIRPSHELQHVPLKSSSSCLESDSFPALTRMGGGGWRRSNESKQRDAQRGRV